jgi:hypothetical protein
MDGAKGLTFSLGRRRLPPRDGIFLTTGRESNQGSGFYTLLKMRQSMSSYTPYTRPMSVKKFYLTFKARYGIAISIQTYREGIEDTCRIEPLGIVYIENVKQCSNHCGKGDCESGCRQPHQSCEV